MDDSGRRYHRRRTGRKYVINPPPPLPAATVIILAMLAIVGTLQAFLSNYPLPWGVLAGVSVFGVGYLVVRSLVPVKQYRPLPDSPDDGPSAAANQPAPGPPDYPRQDSNL